MSMPFQLTDKVVVLIGGTSGIGEAIAKRLINAGAKLVIAGVNANEPALQTLEAHYVYADVTDEFSLSELMAIAFERMVRLMCW
ncbi:hypothetical protein JCM19239_4626 [Vibrio variabilis]|uniref:Uncharacterized protein n=1 Tax=Vibrio variabilis TaxID=990271 RepID=A0ABQ0J810_9VIBR|nr:hypothetical protein JCM19239_4626 [Vibrio variabilis]